MRNPHRLHRLKLVITLVMIIICALAPSITICGVLSIFLFVGIALLPDKKKFIKRICLFLPFILATFTIPLYFTPGRILSHGITYEGLRNGAILGIRTFLAIGYSLIFLLSTPVNEIANSLDWITMNKLRLGDTLKVAMKFAELVKNGRKNSITSTLKYAIEECRKFIYAKYKA